jgi:hypothetical protein
MMGSHKIRLLIALLWLFPMSASAGVLVTPEAHWMNFSFRPPEGQDTVNYYGGGAGARFGYSVAQVLDLAGVSSYSVARANKAAKLSDRDATLVVYGAEIAIRPNHALYLAARGLSAERTLLSQTKDAETPGAWSGNGLGMAIAGIMRLNGKSNFLQVGVSAMSFPIMKCGTQCASGWQQQRLETFSVELAFVLNNYESTSIDNSPFANYVKEMLVW